MYTPALKARESELAALDDAHAHGLYLLPLIDLVAHTGTAPRGTMSEAAYSCEQLAAHWPESHYIDPELLAPAAADKAMTFTIVNAFHSAAAVPPPIPVLRLGDPAAVQAAAAGVAAASGNVAVRIPLSTTLAVPASLATTLAALTSAVGLTAGDVHLIFDWADLPLTTPLDSLEIRTRAALAAAGAGWGRVVVLGTAAPIAPSGDYHNTYPRREWWLWLRLTHGAALPQAVDFADYVGFPAPNPSYGRPKTATVRYSHGNDLHIARRGPTATPARTGFARCCDDILALPGFPGAAFSTGDATIVDVAAGAAYPGGGNGATWRVVALQHHLARVVTDMITPPPAPPAGTV